MPDCTAYPFYGENQYFREINGALFEVQTTHVKEIRRVLLLLLKGFNYLAHVEINNIISHYKIWEFWRRSIFEPKLSREVIFFMLEVINEQVGHVMVRSHRLAVRE